MSHDQDLDPAPHILLGHSDGGSIAPISDTSPNVSPHNICLASFTTR